MNQKDAIRAFLGDDTQFSGLLTFDGIVKIDGKFEGEIKTEDGGELVIGPAAVVKAEILVGSLTIQGTVEGNIVATKKLKIESQGKVIGNVSSPALHIEDGAVLDGSVSMTKPPTPPSKTVSPSRPERAKAVKEEPKNEAPPENEVAAEKLG